MTFTEPLASAMAAAQNFIFIALHVYYLWGYFVEAVQGSAVLSNSKKTTSKEPDTSVQNNRLAATLTLFASSILVMINDMVLGIVRTVISLNPFAFFLVVFGGQIISDIIYCSYMRRFATALLKEKQARSIPMSNVYNPPSAHVSDREDMQGGMPGPRYVSIDGHPMNSHSYRTDGIQPRMPVEMPSSFPARHSDGFV
ncbi:hypothetical protein M427DRAFT_43544 [Gonapodya prolifera JEL478]|uniref:Uncharacterized protein n=1 Tax=Gonapodya prolifera (strain JEL478) TaxID=1344416 RepID=A0A139AHZ7_GONPJ|nr:hypothetical protein M427DRAFT_43544 [Gonapodya prolifera JEL478]|eukprot:KXS16452.1 hypothetical protein M427DRAFT_43544 [Gonapodya prolifera JEL478]